MYYIIYNLFMYTSQDHDFENGGYALVRGVEATVEVRVGEKSWHLQTWSEYEDIREALKSKGTFS